MTTGSAPPEDFVEQVKGFGVELGDLLKATIQFPTETQIDLTYTDGPRAVVELVTLDGANQVPMTVAGHPTAKLLVRIGCRRDSTGQYMAVTQSNMAIYSALENTPLFRLEFRDDMRDKPSCHWQVHAERGALSNLLTLGGHSKPHQLSALHIPVGGTRMRPGVEDFLQFAIDELHVDSVKGFRNVLADSRESWRRRQIAALVRDVPDEAVRVLKNGGFRIRARRRGRDRPVRADTLRKW